MLERMALIRDKMPGVEEIVTRTPPPGAAVVHLLQATGLLWTARRAAGRAMQRLPMDPNWDSARHAHGTRALTLASGLPEAPATPVLMRWPVAVAVSANGPKLPRYGGPLGQLTHSPGVDGQLARVGSELHHRTDDRGLTVHGRRRDEQQLRVGRVRLDADQERRRRGRRLRVEVGDHDAAQELTVGGVGDVAQRHALPRHPDEAVDGDVAGVAGLRLEDPVVPVDVAVARSRRCCWRPRRSTARSRSTLRRKISRPRLVAHVDLAASRPCRTWRHRHRRRVDRSSACSAAHFGVVQLRAVALPAREAGDERLVLQDRCARRRSSTRRT